MIWAIKNNIKIKATPKDKAKCSICDSEVIAKCGRIKVWHWAHKDNKDCDDWYEPESEWHLKWKNEFPKECQEFTIGRHRADIRTKSRWIIELQNSSISSEEIKDREEYYKRMVWLLNGRKFADNFEININGKWFNLIWKHPRKCWWYSNKEIYIDLSEYLIYLKTKLKSYKSGSLTHTSPVYEEYEFYNEHIDDYMTGSKICGYIDDTTQEIKRLNNLILKLNNKILFINFLDKKTPCRVSGNLITKEEFINKFK